MAALELPDTAQALIPPLDTALAGSGGSDGGRMPPAAAVARALRRAGWPAEWVLVFVRDRASRIARSLAGDARSGSEPAWLERNQLLAALECLRVYVGEMAPSAGAWGEARATEPEPARVAPALPQRTRPRDRRAYTGPRRASGRQLQIRATPARRARA